MKKYSLGFLKVFCVFPVIIVGTNKCMAAKDNFSFSIIEITGLESNEYDIINLLNMRNLIVFCFVFSFLCFSSCEKRNVHSDTLEGGMYRVVGVEGIEFMGKDSVFENLYGCDIFFNMCLPDMNKAWGTEKEKKGDCQMLVSGNADEYRAEDEYRFHLISEYVLEIKWLETHYESNKLPDLSGRYSFTVEDRQMVMTYEGDEKELEGLEIHCEDWNPL